MRWIGHRHELGIEKGKAAEAGGIKNENGEETMGIPEITQDGRVFMNLSDGILPIDKDFVD